MTSTRSAISPLRRRSCRSSRYKRTLWPYASGVRQETTGLSEIATSRCLFDEVGTNLLVAAAIRPRAGLDDLWPKQCGLDTGRRRLWYGTALALVVGIMSNDGGIRAVRFASTGDILRRAAVYAAAALGSAIVLLPRGPSWLGQPVQPLASGGAVLSLEHRTSMAGPPIVRGWYRRRACIWRIDGSSLRLRADRRCRS